MKNVVCFEDDEIRLCSGLDEFAFGKTHFNSITTQTGILATCDTTKNEALHFSFEDWNFDDVKSFELEGISERIVFYCKKSTFSKNAKTLLEIYDEAGKENASKESKDNMFSASFAVCSILTQAAKEGITFPVNGAGGIIVDGLKEDEQLKVLFLPQNLFTNSITGLSNIEQCNLHNCWINPSLTGLPAISFERACIAYKMLTGKYAYPASDNLSRNADILDKKFLPLELCINGIDKALSEAVNKGLMLNSNSVAIPGKKIKGKKSEELHIEADFPLSALYESKNNTSSAMSQEDFEEKVNSYLKLQESRINTKRTIRRNTTTITCSIIAVIIIAICIRGGYKNRLEDYTTKSFTSEQTIQAYFNGLNNMDIALLQSFTSGKSINKNVDVISNFFVISKQIQSSGGTGYIKPAKYFLTIDRPAKATLAGLYGFTNLKIDGVPYNEYVNFPQNKDKPEPVTQEKGVTINNKDTSVHSVEYYILHTEGDNSDIYVTKNKDTFILTYKKDKWIITDVESSSEDMKLNSNEFKTIFFNKMADNNFDAVKTVQQLSLTYDFLPSNEEMLKEKKIIEDIANDPFFGLF